MPGSAASAAPAVTAPLRLPADLTIYAVAELQPQWLAWMSALASRGEDSADVDAQGVEQVDAAGLQLLVSLQRTLVDRGLRMCLRQPSRALREGCDTLGLWDAFKAGSSGAAA